jgi:hypothetical protein
MMPVMRLLCGRCKASGRLFAVGAVWDEGAGERCAHFAGTGLTPVLSECPNIRRLIEGFQQPNPSWIETCPTRPD